MSGYENFSGKMTEIVTGGGRAGIHVRSTFGCVTHPFERDEKLLTEYNIECRVLIDKGKAVPSFIYWLLSKGLFMEMSGEWHEPDPIGDIEDVRKLREKIRK